MTLHSAKGLEFSSVYLTGLEDGIFPSYMAINSDNPEDIEEERRLAYVGITRAKEDLTVTYAKARMIRGETQYNLVSRFVREIPEQFLDSRIPGVRRWSEDTCEDNSYERSIFKAKPFQTETANRGETLSDTVFDKPRNNWEAAAQLLNPSKQQPKAAVKTPTGQTPAKKDFSEIMASRPKAVVRKKETPAANKPYIAKSLDGLTKGAPSISADGPGYAVGDRVLHVKYGEGVVANIVQEARDFKVTVTFDAYGNKIMYAAFAKLKKV